ncbi:MAG: carboxypeptidase-like regulatory domain-containing protein [Paludibacteraceae bacterium]|nr:carboxypeptidase-like regulatory domain-containing protein [Paludibacteraceae bacterium]
MKKIISLLFLSLISLLGISAAEYKGRVVDTSNQPISFATVYLLRDPVVGTATGSDGTFVLETDYPPQEIVIISFIGYSKREIPLSRLQGSDIVLTEQPIALQETVITAKAGKQRNKRKKMKDLLRRVYTRMSYDFSDEPAGYRIVSDVRMNSAGTPWGMEQMIASAVNIPKQGTEGRDSVQFVGEHCKRFFPQSIRNKADNILEAEWLDKNVKRMANEVDSGVVVHQGLWAIGNIRYDFEKTMNDVRHWEVSNESENETVLTHTEKKNFIGIFKYSYKRHYILDSESLSVLRFAEELEMAVNIPFGYKFKSRDLEMLNLLNMSENNIEKFRLRKARAYVTLNTIYQRVNGMVYHKEKNLSATGVLIGTRDMQIPIDVKATQRVTNVTAPAQPLPGTALRKRITRELVPLF